MKAYYVTGTKGSYIELEDGRFADTVSGDTSEATGAHEALEALQALATEYSDDPLCSDMSAPELEAYTGAVDLDEGIVMSDAAAFARIADSSMRQAVREGRVASERKGHGRGIWMITRRAIVEAIQAGRIRPGGHGDRQ